MHAKLCYQCILRIDPEDTVAEFYKEALDDGKLIIEECNYVYRLPELETRRRRSLIASYISSDLKQLSDNWRNPSEFRKVIKWAAQADEAVYQNAAMMTIAIYR